MVAQVQLCNLVDLALCDPEVGAVNFNHLRTLLHCMLKLTNHANNFVDHTLENSNNVSNNVEPNYVCNGSSSAVDGTSVSQEDGEPKVSVIKEDIPEISSAADAGGLGYVEPIKDESEFNHLVDNQKNLEGRILNLEKSLTAIEEFPSNYEILNDGTRDGEEINTQKNEDNSNKMNRLSNIWQNKKILKRMEASEEAIDKLFSLMDDILKQDQLMTKSEYENMKNQQGGLQNQLDRYTNSVTKCEDGILNNKSLIEECVYKMSEYVDGSKSSNEDGSEYVINRNDDEETEEVSSDCIQQNDSNLLIDMDKFMLMLDEKADFSELGNKADTVDLNIMQNEITQLTEQVNGINEKLIDNSANLDTGITDSVNADTCEQTLDLHISTADSTFSEIKKDLAQLKQIMLNIDDEKLRLMLDNTGELQNVSNEKEDMCILQNKMENIVMQMEHNKNVQNEVNENLMNSQNELAMLIPTLDTSVIAAIQHLTQENRHQITALQTNMRMLQESQMMIRPTLPKNDDSEINSDQNLEMLQILQNRLLSFQDEQVKQAGHISNMVDDYKEEFNRKQLHIDALYDYIDKLQHIKADKDEVTVEMSMLNVKSDKQALDNKVNMSTFDERYQMLEQSLQHALSRLDQYAEQETSLKDAFSKLSEDMNSKMDSDAERKLKKFLDSRLKDIQVSRTHLPDEHDLRNAAGLRRPMPLSYNCLSCDRPIDVKMRGVMPPIPNYLPGKKTLGSLKGKDDDSQSKASSSFVVANRACGGSHTSVNINMLRMLPNSSHSNLSLKTSKELSDCVIGNDGQIYRGRFKLHGSSYDKQNKLIGRDNKRRKTHSAKTPSKRNDSSKMEDRSQSAECKKSLSLPSINHEFDSDIHHVDTL